MNELRKYEVHFRDFLRNQIDFSCEVLATSMNNAVDVARLSITMPKYVIADVIKVLD